MRAGRNRDRFRLGLAGGRLAKRRRRFGNAIQGREKPNLRRTPGSKNEKAPTEKQSASLIEVFDERMVALALVGERWAQTLPGVSQRPDGTGDELNVAPQFRDR
jgi:hypothetical protein